MDVHVYVHFDSALDSDRANRKLDQLLAQMTNIGVKIMAVSDQLKQLAADLDTETNAIAARIDALVAKLGDTVDPAVVAQFQAISDRLTSLGQDASNPIPPAV